MEGIVGVIIAVVSLLVVNWFGKKSGEKKVAREMNEVIEEVERANAEDELDRRLHGRPADRVAAAIERARQRRDARLGG